MYHSRRIFFRFHYEMKINLIVVVLILNAKMKNLNTIQAPVDKLYLATIQPQYQKEDLSACSVSKQSILQNQLIFV